MAQNVAYIRRDFFKTLFAQNWGNCGCHQYGTFCYPWSVRERQKYLFPLVFSLSVCAFVYRLAKRLLFIVWTGVRQVPESSEEQAKMKKTGREIIRGAQTTLEVKG